MKRNKLILPVMFSFILSSCGSSRTYELSYYHKKLTYNDNFNICVLSDVHLSILSDMEYECEYLKNVIYANAILDGIDVSTASDSVLSTYAPDMIMINGDAFQTATKSVVDYFFSFMDSLEIPFAYTYGNHDYHALYGYKYVDKKIKSCKNSLLINPKDNIFGESNYVIDIVNPIDENDIKWQVYVLDSNEYYGLEYDIIHDDQIKWYEDQVNETTISQGKTVPSLMFFHIPIEEFEEVWKLETDGKCTNNPNQSFANYNPKSDFAMYDLGVAWGYKENDLFETAQRLKSTKGIICSHDHTNNTDFYYDKNGDGAIRLIYTTKTGHGIYHDKRIMGANFIYLDKDATVDSDPSLSFVSKRINLSYSGEAFVMTSGYINNGFIREE